MTTTEHQPHLAGSDKAARATIPAIFQETAGRFAQRIALRTPGGGVSSTWREYADAVRRTAEALAGLGVQRGDRVAMLSRNRPELAVLDSAASHLGAATVALYAASPNATIAHVLADCRPRVLAVESELGSRLQGVGHVVEHVVRLDGEGGVLPGFATIDAPAGFRFESAWRAVREDDLLYVLYTSGTTGLPKGVEWEHGAAVRAIERVTLDDAPGGIRDLSILPFAHAMERGGGHLRGMVHGSSRTFCADPAQLGLALLDARPTFLVGPPRMWQGLKVALEATFDDSDRAAVTAAIAHMRPRSGNAVDRSLEGPLARLRVRIGLDQITHALTAAAPCPRAVHEFFVGLGVPLGELYGMTELFGVSMAQPGWPGIGTCGAALPGYALRLAGDGEIEVRADSRARGYRNDPVETAATFGADGWLRTGDVGRLDDGGRLRIVDRKKELLIPADGHNVAPAAIESELKSRCPLIGHVCIVGDGRPHLAALVVLDPPGRDVDAAARAGVAAAIEQLNDGLDPRERVLAHTILHDPWLPGFELTETLKLRRRTIAARHAAVIDAMFG